MSCSFPAWPASTASKCCCRAPAATTFSPATADTGRWVWNAIGHGYRKPCGPGLAGLAKGLPARPPALRRLGKAFQYADLDGDARLASYFHWLDSSLVESLLTPDIRAASQGDEPLVTSLAALPAGWHR